MAYEWCSVICENRNLEDWESRILATLEIGFRHLGPQDNFLVASLIHTEYHQKLVNIVFRSQKGEAIADILRAWTAHSLSREPEYALLGTCAEHLVDLHHVVPFSPRLRELVIGPGIAREEVQRVSERILPRSSPFVRQNDLGSERISGLEAKMAGGSTNRTSALICRGPLVIRSIGIIGSRGFEGMGVEGFIELLNHLHVTAEDMDREIGLTTLLFDILQSPERLQYLSHWYWELLAELAISYSPWLRHNATYSPQITGFLTEAQEWSKLECWMGIIWVVWPPGAGGMTEEDLGSSMLLLFRQRPGAAQKLEQWVGRRSQHWKEDIPESFQRICKQAHEEAQRDAP